MPVFRFSLHVHVHFLTKIEKEAFMARLSHMRDLFSLSGGTKVHNYEQFSQLLSLAETRSIS